jgi:hypothetical protein
MIGHHFGGYLEVIMSLVQQFYLGMVIAGFSLFFVALMSVWIWTRGWQTRTDPVAATEPSAVHDDERPRMAA